MKEKSYSRINECMGFWTWLYHEFDVPAGFKHSISQFKHCGSLYRRHFIRIFGHETEWTYWEKER